MRTNGTAPDSSGPRVKGDRRTLHRALMEVSGRLSSEAGRVDCVVLDLSLGGAMVKIDTDAANRSVRFSKADENLTLMLECGVPVSLPASVVWHKGSIMGLQFVQDPAEVTNELARLLPPECFAGLAERKIARPRP